jgi:hypothetical protein
MFNHLHFDLTNRFSLKKCYIRFLDKSADELRLIIS